MRPHPEQNILEIERLRFFPVIARLKMMTVQEQPIGGRAGTALFRLCGLLLCTAALLIPGAAAVAQPPAATGTPPAGLGTALRGGDPKVDAGRPAKAPADPLIAIVEGRPIYLSQLGRATQALPSSPGVTAASAADTVVPSNVNARW